MRNPLDPERCSVAWCTRESYALTFCTLHYRRATRQDGNPITAGEQAAYERGFADGQAALAARF